MPRTHRQLVLAVAFAALGGLATGLVLAAETPSAPGRSVSRSGLAYVPDDARAGPREIVDAIRARRAGGKLLNLDRMLLNSPPFAQG